MFVHVRCHDTDLSTAQGGLIMRRKLNQVCATKAEHHRCPFQITPPSLAGPERLVGLGFRYWMLGQSTGDVACWERAWELYSGTFGVVGGRAAVGQLSSWVSALSKTSRRGIEVSSPSCRSFCRDECVAISMIAACQHRTCPALRACAFALVETSMIDGVVQQAQVFADTLAGLDHILSPAAIVRTPATMSLDHATAH